MGMHIAARDARRGFVAVDTLERRVHFAASPAGVAEYVNPLEVKLADPSVLDTRRGESRYYLSGTGSSRYVSDDLVNWRRDGEWVSLGGTSYGNIWASEVVERKVPGLGVQFYYLFSAIKDGSDQRVIGVARAASPDAAAFEVLGELPLDPAKGWIDPHVLVAGKRAYLYVTSDLDSNADGHSRIHVAELGQDMTTLTTEPRVIVEQSEAWESTWIEGAAVVRQGRFYYLTYSSNCYCGERYAVGVATSRTPDGPWVKSAGGPVLQQHVDADPANFGHTGPGHNGFVRAPRGRELFMVYHTHVTGAFGGVRQVNMDRVTFARGATRQDPPRLVVGTSTGDGPTGAPTKTPQPYPRGVAPTPTAVDDAFDGDTLDRNAWRNIWGDRPGDWAVEGGQLVVTARGGQVFEEQNDGANVFLQQAPAGDWTITTAVTFDAQQNFEHAFLTVWQDSNNYVMLKHVFAGGRQIESSRELAQDYASQLTANSLGDGASTVFLQIRKTGDIYAPFYGPDGVNWLPGSDPVTLPLLDVKVGVGAWIPGSDRQRAEARFDLFDIEP